MSLRETLIRIYGSPEAAERWIATRRAHGARDMAAEGRALSAWLRDHPEAVYQPPGQLQLERQRPAGEAGRSGAGVSSCE